MITLDETKKHLNIDIEYLDDDDYISLLLDVCTIAVKNEINDTTTADITLILPLKQAILLLVGNLYANREPVAYSTVVKIPYTFDFLINAYRKYD
jgi:uncharacterized phage protein (predicted DNA packaging)